jgi:predicted amidohydrolase
MLRCALALLLLTGLLSGEPLFRQSGFSPGADGWTVWSARPETRPNTFVDLRVSRGEAGSLGIGGASNAAEHGGWERTVAGITPGTWYRFTAHYQADSVGAENWQIVARLDWRTATGKRAGQPEYVAHARREGSWTRLTTQVAAPKDAAGVVVQLYLSNAPTGTVWWDDLTLEKIADPGARTVRVSTVNLYPRNTSGSAESVGQFIETIERSVPSGVDVILLPEGITIVGTSKTFAEIAETIPGPTTLRLAEVARKRKAYVVAGIYEREGTTLYNTAVMLDRDGTLAGKYRKVYLPREEVERGLTPGSSYPVFPTDFGKVGLMICYDVFFSDPARALATQGAEMILMPIWGGDEALAKARAIENQVFLVASGYNHPTYIMDPSGERLSEARERGTAATATIDLNRSYADPWLGEMRTRRWREQRVDVPVPAPGLER